MSCGGSSSFGGCGGSSEIRIPIESGGCGGARKYLYANKRSSGCGGDSHTTFSVDSGGCGGRIPASNEDIRRAFEYNRKRGW